MGSLPFVGWYLLWGVVAACARVVMSSPEARVRCNLGRNGGLHRLLSPQTDGRATDGVPERGVVIKSLAWCYLGVWIVLQLFAVHQGIPGVRLVGSHWRLRGRCGCRCCLPPERCADPPLFL